MTPQLSLFEQTKESPEIPEAPKARMRWRDIDIKALESELSELAGSLSVKVRLDSKLAMAISIKESDPGFFIRLNPRKLKSPEMLEEHLNMCRIAVAGE